MSRSLVVLMKTTGNQCEKSKALSGWRSLYNVFTIEARQHILLRAHFFKSKQADKESHFTLF